MKSMRTRRYFHHFRTIYDYKNFVLIISSRGREKGLNMKENKWNENIAFHPMTVTRIYDFHTRQSVE